MFLYRNTFPGIQGKNIKILLGSLNPVWKGCVLNVNITFSFVQFYVLFGCVYF